MKPSALVLAALLVAWPSTAARADSRFDSCHNRTGNNATVIVPSDVIEIDGAPLEFEDEVAVFTPDGVCAGHLQWDASNAALAIWADDPMTDLVEGFVAGEALSYAVWDASSNTVLGRGIGSVDVSYDAEYDNDGIFHSDAIYLVSEISVSSEISNEIVPETTFALDPNFPNPFGSRTTIRYGLPEDTHVKLEIYDLLGHRVGVLVDGFLRAGNHEVDVVAGSDWASGVYVYRLQAGLFTSHRKMILVK